MVEERSKGKRRDATRLAQKKRAKRSREEKYDRDGCQKLRITEEDAIYEEKGESLVQRYEEKQARVEVHRGKNKASECEVV